MAGGCRRLAGCWCVVCVVCINLKVDTGYWRSLVSWQPAVAYLLLYNKLQYMKSWQCETGTSAGELRAEPRAMHLVNHPFRLDYQRLLSYLTSRRVLTLAVTPAISTTFWSTIYFYTASAAAGNLGYDCARGRHRTVSAAASRRHVDASLDSFARKKPT
jgi:hypothetical protein